MIDPTSSNYSFNHYFSKKIKQDFLFSFDSYQLFLERLSLDPFAFLEEWSNDNRQNNIDKYWHSNTNLDWKWALAFPILSLLEKYIENINSPKILGISGLPGSGKSTLGLWINNVSRDLNLEIKVISLDDFYLPAEQMNSAIRGNPWNVSRGFPGSHSLDLLNNSLDNFLKCGVLKSPIFDKSLRDGRGDRSGWTEARLKVLILEGWFVGCDPISNLIKLNDISYNQFNSSLNEDEKDYRKLIQSKLLGYKEIWRKLDKLWHLKSDKFNNTVLWKTQQESSMLINKGSALKGKKLMDFIRMIQASIPQDSLSSIKSDTIIEINQNRNINKLFTNKYFFK